MIYNHSKLKLFTISLNLTLKGIIWTKRMAKIIGKINQTIKCCRILRDMNAVKSPINVFVIFCLFFKEKRSTSSFESGFYFSDFQRNKNFTYRSSFLKSNLVTKVLTISCSFISKCFRKIKGNFLKSKIDVFQKNNLFFFYFLAFNTFFQDSVTFFSPTYYNYVQ